MREAVESPDSSARDVAQLISSDPAITARLLKVVNSVVYGMPRGVESVVQAVNIMGMQPIHDIILTSSVTTTFAGVPYGLMNVSRFWSHSLLCALSARALGKRANLIDHDRLFLVGLLSRVGRLVMYDKIPQLTAVALSHSERTGQQLYGVERQLIGCDYAAVGGDLLARWRLPESIVAMILEHVEPVQAHSSVIGAAIVHLAAAAADAATSSKGHVDAAKFDPYLWEATGLTPEILADVEKKAGAEFVETAKVFVPTLAEVA
ncbi:MAG: HDOD domain-containing protein [Betaproteobacteria bacterium]|nr:HDOD domain-containing protein [Betaproteobacteria bacterium]